MRERGPGRGAVFASVILHVGLIGGMVASAQAKPKLPPMKVYAVALYSPPPQVRGEPEPVASPAPAPAEAASPKPAAEKPEPKPPETKAPPAPKPKPKPEPKKEPAKTPPAKTSEPKTTTKAPEKKTAAQPAKGARPDPKSAGGEDLNVKLEGEAFPFPDYLENIIRQVNRYFRWDGAPELKAEIYFVIHRDGSVSDLRVLSGSGNPQFDLEALGAAEVAGKRGAFGPLPDGFQADRLPVSFTIEPPGR